jgi:beta-galactosidase
LFRYGADYYPEHWPEERWPEDARLMKGAGFNVVRLAEFAWSLMEPQQGSFEFDWLDRAITVLAKQGIDVVLGTPTASPPPWLMAKREDLFMVNEDGMRMTYGLRREYCPNNPLYHQYTQQIVDEMAAHYMDNQAVIGWQIDNEFGAPCYCEICRVAFHRWLQERYTGLDVLNEKWGTIFWSHVYTDWSQIPIPLKIAGSHNPGLHLDYKRFMSDTYRTYQKMQIDIVRKHSTDQFITHNLMGFGYNQLDYYQNSADLDFVSWDNYLRHQWDMTAGVDPSQPALNHDTMRGLKKQNFWVMEQQSGGGWELVAVPPKPGEMRLWAYQSVARGADGIIYFRWRTCRTGAEQYWHGILDHHGIPGRRYEEAALMGKELQAIGTRIKGLQNKSQVAIMQSYDTRFAFQVQQNNPRFEYEKHIRDIHTAFYNLNVMVDIISEVDDFSGYKLVIVPAMYVLSEETAASLERFAAAGGLVVLTPRTGVKDESNAAVNMKLPGLVAEMTGVEVEEYISMPIDEDNRVQFTLLDLDNEFTVSTWADVLELTTAEMAARYCQDYYSGRAAVSINAFGDGQVIYIGTMGDEEFYAYIAKWVLDLVDVTPTLLSPPGVEVTQRWDGDRCYLFVLNHNAGVAEIRLEDRYTNLLSNQTLSGTIALNPYDVLILVQGDQDETSRMD